MDIKKTVSQMTLEEKAGMCSGLDFWHLKAVERLGVDSVMVSDGPHGLRKQDLEADHLGINESIKAVCFPAACGTAASFSREMMQTMGEALGNECQAEGVGVLLGPAINIKRSPLCGRNFEYVSEDPYLAGELAAAYTKGVQSQNVGVSVKHYAANNQEERRMTVSAEIDERTLREIYLPGFEAVVKQADPWTIMCSYNRINGEYVAQSHKLLTEILRDEWGFNGYVMTDWGACDDRVLGLEAGQDLEMPSSGGVNDAEIVKAVKEGRISEAVLDTAVERILTINQKFLEHRSATARFDRDNDHQLAREIARESMVLLKNEGGLLPLGKGQKVAFIGEFAEKPRFQGGGSSHINAHKVVGALAAAKAQGLEVTYAQGYRVSDDEADEALVRQAVEAAKEADVAVVFAGLPDRYESEGFDRSHMQLPAGHNALIEAVAAAQPNCVVVLHNGSPVEMPWLAGAKAVLESYLGGQAVGEAQVDLLFGAANPCGKLAETFPLRLEDNPSYLNFPGEGNVVEYREGVFVGYRWYDSTNKDVLFPFGHGLSYTSFAYSNMAVDKTQLAGNDEVTVRLTVKNTGAVAGKEIVQLYVRPVGGSVIRPEKELKGFAKVQLAPGEEKTVAITLGRRAFAHYSATAADWVVEAGDYELLAGASSRNIKLSATVKRTDAAPAGWRVTRNTTVGDLLANPVSAEVLRGIMAQSGIGQSLTGNDSDLLGEATSSMRDAMFRNAPLRAMISFMPSKMNNTVLQQLVDTINGALEKAEQA